MQNSRQVADNFFKYVFMNQNDFVIENVLIFLFNGPTEQ